MPEDNLLGELHRGFYLIMANFQGERLGDVARRARRDARVVRADGRVGGRPAARRRRGGFALAELATLIEASAAMTYGTLRRAVAGEDAVREVTMAKLLTQRANVHVQETCVRLRGIEGVLEETGLERALRDARLGPIGGGTDEMMKRDPRQNRHRRVLIRHTFPGTIGGVANKPRPTTKNVRRTPSDAGFRVTPAGATAWCRPANSVASG